MYLSSFAFTVEGPQGPPFSVPRKEVLELFSSLELVESSEKPVTPSDAFAERLKSDFLRAEYIFRR